MLESVERKGYLGDIVKLNTQSDMPLYKQISQILRERISKGEWKVHDKIPPEPELCKEFDVSRITIRLALDELCHEGIIFRRQGKGTFISQPKINQQLSSFYSFNGKLEDGQDIRKEIVSWKQGAPDEEQTAALQIEPSSSVFIIQRVIYSNNIPFAVEESCVLSSLCASLSKEMVQTNGLYASLDVFNVRPNRAQETLEAIILPEFILDHFKEQGPLPGFRVCRTSWHDNFLIEYCRSYVNGKLIQYKVALQ